jgi:hypothetical protein
VESLGVFIPGSTLQIQRSQGLTMFVPVVCSQCSKPFQVPEEAVGKQSACPWCQAAVLALPAGEQSEAEKYPLPESPEPLSLDDVDPSPIPAIQQPSAEPSSHKRLIRLVIGLFLMATAAATTFAILQRKQGHLISMEWQPFAPADASCQIELLGHAKEVDWNPEPGERRYYSQGWYSGTSAWIGWQNLTPVQAQEAAAKDGWVQYRKLFFDQERDRLKDRFGGSIAKDATIDQNPITVEVRLEGGQRGSTIERMMVIPNSSVPRIYFIGMSGKRLDLDGPEVKRFFSSFRVND